MLSFFFIYLRLFFNLILTYSIHITQSNGSHIYPFDALSLLLVLKFRLHHLLSELCQLSLGLGFSFSTRCAGGPTIAHSMLRQSLHFIISNYPRVQKVVSLWLRRLVDPFPVVVNSSALSFSALEDFLEIWQIITNQQINLFGLRTLLSRTQQR